MKFTKACVNKNCNDYCKHIKVNSSVQFCNKCGEELIPVCTNPYCIEPPAKETGGLCISHLEELETKRKEDRQFRRDLADKIVNKIDPIKIFSGAVVAAAPIAKKGFDAIRAIKK